MRITKEKKKMQVNEYYPSLLARGYQLGEVYMFIRHKDVSAKKLSECAGLEEEKGKLILDKSEGGLVLDRVDSGKGKLVLDTGEVEYSSGKLVKDNGQMKENVGFIENNGLEKYEKYTKLLGKYRYEAGRIIGIDEENEKIYVQFLDTPENWCHIFKTAISSERFDVLDKWMKNSGKRFW